MAEIKRFYTMFQPENYNIFLDINREEKIFSGKTSITGEAKTPTIMLHQKGLQVSSVQVDDVTVNFSIDNQNDAIQIQLNQIGKVTLTIEYQAVLTDTMMGIYPSYYEVDGVKKQIIGTQFETTFARQAFPGIDEPEAKATFDLAIKFDEQPGETILSNMPETKMTNGIHYFDRTVKMSTYLVAFAFGDLQSKITTTKSGVKVGVFSTKAHQPHELDFALDIAKRSIEFYEEFYQTPYPLPHSWQLALPDFSAGAMENWGLVTYREVYLLLDPENTALDTKQLVASVIAHELAHQWFGDLVTMQWWDDLWLNESFANMMEYVALDAIEPTWHIWEMFQSTEAPLALQRDATDGVQSVHVHVEDPAEIDALFDGAIVYAKGSRLLVMVRALIGDQALRLGLKQYFAKHQYGNATGDDLWKALGDASGIDIGTIMDLWLEQPGYPVVTVSVVDGELILNQHQFFIGEGQEAGRQWAIPLSANYGDVPRILDQQNINLGNYKELRKSNNKPFRINVGNDAHVIVKYDAELLDDILANVDTLTPIDQLQLLQDLRLLAEGLYISYAEIVPLLSKFADSESALVNDALYLMAGDLKKFVAPGSGDEQKLQKLFNQLSQGQVARLGWEQQDGESNDDQLTRPYVLNAALFANNQAVIDTAHKLFEENQNNLIEIAADIRALVLKNEVKNFGNTKLFERLFDEYHQTSDASYKVDLCQALTSAKDQKWLSQLVSKFEDANAVKPQDLRAWFIGVLANENGQQAAWDWVRNDWQWLEDTVGGDMEFTTYITRIAKIFRTPERLLEFKEFFEPKLDTPGLTREIVMDIKVIESRVKLIKEEKAAVIAAITAEIE